MTIVHIVRPIGEQETAVARAVPAAASPGSAAQLPRGAHDPVDHLLMAGRRLAVAGGAMLLVVHIANAAWLERRLLDANLEATVWTWASVVAAAGVAVGAGLHALSVRARRLQFATLAVAAAFLSLDDLVVLHEFVAEAIMTRAELSDAWDSVVWPIAYLPFLAAVVLLVERLTRDAQPRIRRHAVAGLALLAFAVAAEAVTAPWSGQERNWVHTIAGGVEEAAELGGWTLLAVALMAAALGAMLQRASDGAERVPPPS